MGGRRSVSGPKVKIPTLSQRTREGWGTRDRSVKIPTSRKEREKWGTREDSLSSSGTKPKTQCLRPKTSQKNGEPRLPK